MHILMNDIGRIGNGTLTVLSLIVGIIMLLAYLAVAMRISWEMTLLAFAVGAILQIILLPQLKRSQRLGEALTFTARKASRRISEFLAGLKLAKSHASEHRYISSYAAVLDVWNREIVSFTRSDSFFNALYQTSAAVAVSILFFVAYEHLEIPTAQLIVLIFILSRLLPRISGIQNGLQDALVMLPAYESVITAESACRPYAEKLSKSDWVPELKQGIRLKGVSFSYREEEPPVLGQINLLIPANQTTAIIGRSGFGKSTLADIISGLVPPSEGQVCIDEQCLMSDNLLAWRSVVAYIPQETYLFYGTVRENLLLVEPGRQEHELLDALRAAAADEFVASLPDGLDTLVGEGGVRLSGGERQRIALARALLCKPRVLILDEATSALDDENEANVHRAIDALHGAMTIIFITDRASTLQYADLVVELNKGAVGSVRKNLQQKGCSL